jgi:geranylgeranyl reductase family protein
MLALGGARVCLLERYRFPRNKPCGGGITTRALRRFPYLRDALATIDAHYISTLYLEGPSRGHVVFRSPEPAVVTVRRIEFDGLLTRLAVRAGADLVEGAWVADAASGDADVGVVTRDGRRFEGRFLVAADGVNGIVARRLGFHAGWSTSAVALDVMEETPVEQLRAVEPSTLWVSYGHGGAEGYGYIFPKRAHVNVGFGCVLSHFKQRVSDPPYDLQQRFVESLRRRGLLEGRSSRAGFTAYHVPVGGPLPATSRGRALVVGDAGGFVNAYTAEGIYYAMVSGDLAARAVLSGDDVSDPHPGSSVARRYERAWRREIGPELRDSVLIQRYLFRDPARIDRVVAGAAAHREVARVIVAYATGELSYAAARRRLVAAFPRLVFRLVRTAAGAESPAAGELPRCGSVSDRID